MNEAQKHTDEEKKPKHQGVLAYTHKIGDNFQKDIFYADALNRAFYELYVLA